MYEAGGAAASATAAPVPTERRPPCGTSRAGLTAPSPNRSAGQSRRPGLHGFLPRPIRSGGRHGGDRGLWVVGAPPVERSDGARRSHLMQPTPATMSPIGAAAICRAACRRRRSAGRPESGRNGHCAPHGCVRLRVAPTCGPLRPPEMSAQVRILPGRALARGRVVNVFGPVTARNMSDGAPLEQIVRQDRLSLTELRCLSVIVPGPPSDDRVPRVHGGRRAVRYRPLGRADPGAAVRSRRRRPGRNVDCATPAAGPAFSGGRLLRTREVPVPGGQLPTGVVRT